MKIAGVVVLYNSPLSCLENINTYINQVDILFAIDNSDRINELLVETLKNTPKVEYVSNFGNQGISHALNRAAERAVQAGYSFLLTMDDDSSASANMIVEMKKFIAEYPSPDRIGIVGAAHSPATLQIGLPNPVLYTMTSGNLLNLRAYQDVGPFREDFFIDHVDHEYNLRLNSAGYAVIELPSVRLNHPLGEKKRQWGIAYISHHPVRQYYIVRNGLLVARQYLRRYPGVVYKMANLIVKEWIKVFFEQKDRRKRMGLMLKGLKDGLLGRTGKL
ncbi:glycosyltransferase family 2 protein [Spirosoma sp. KNUC1025]|uniref:glycosyltransferase family 2 protein n=1 Tax=Spirosoma sp. KNUC1025 TaxID=2894082 RepID=UPI003865DFC4|nr:glycosyltransferase family 2 protein [Spirosoma sp. KNUC1025]